MSKLGFFLTVVCATMLGVNGAMAQTKTTKKAANAKVAKTAKTKASKEKKDSKDVKAVVDTVSIADFSYAAGLANTEGLKQYLASRLGVDTAKMEDFMRGFNEAVAKKDDKSLKAYAAGIQIGQQVAGQFIPGFNKQITGNENSTYIDESKFLEGFVAGVSGKDCKIPVDSAQKLAQKQMTFYVDRLKEKQYGPNREAGEKFLAENAKKEGVKLIPGSKVQYKVLKEGNGPCPKADDKVSVNYEGKLIDGTVFDSSYKRNKSATFGCNQVIKGWTDALTHMPVGSTWEIYVPQELAYGSRETGDKIKPYSALIFKVELLSIEDKK